MADPIQVYDSGQVTRYHAQPQLSKLLQTNAQHQWGVLAILLALLGAEELAQHPNLMLHAAFHDLGERKAGDLPADFKREFPSVAKAHKQAEGAILRSILGESLPDLSEWEASLLKYADIMEAMIFILLYASNARLVDGWDRSVEQLSEICGQGMDKRLFQFADFYLNPLLNRRLGYKHQVTPF